eukprot:TRINITY_DN10887_c0_g1_i1.p1 TRINITY_DN10887_c0_g1~~TRINITY_DN10887_c0_g1_i1.p1  ORF type:complete len:241 (+),score=49.56 TRINITY_DN10887_c0_g1_i1:40-762(+)
MQSFSRSQISVEKQKALKLKDDLQDALQGSKLYQAKYEEVVDNERELKRTFTRLCQDLRKINQALGFQQVGTPIDSRPQFREEIPSWDDIKDMLEQEVLSRLSKTHGKFKVIENVLERHEEGIHNYVTPPSQSYGSVSSIAKEGDDDTSIYSEDGLLAEEFSMLRDLSWRSVRDSAQKMKATHDALIKSLHSSPNSQTGATLTAPKKVHTPEQQSKSEHGPRLYVGRSSTQSPKSTPMRR